VVKVDSVDHEVLECPFCGCKEAKIAFTLIDMRVYCPSCLAQGPVSVSEIGAIEWWNTRGKKKEGCNGHV
jgi:Lar family restriction alleviation protein